MEKRESDGILERRELWRLREFWRGGNWEGNSGENIPRQHMSWKAGNRWLRTIARDEFFVTKGNGSLVDFRSTKMNIILYQY